MIRAITFLLLGLFSVQASADLWMATCMSGPSGNRTLRCYAGNNSTTDWYAYDWYSTWCRSDYPATAITGSYFLDTYDGGGVTNYVSSPIYYMAGACGTEGWYHWWPEMYVVPVHPGQPFYLGTGGEYGEWRFVAECWS